MIRTCLLCLAVSVLTLQSWAQISVAADTQSLSLDQRLPKGAVEKTILVGDLNRYFLVYAPSTFKGGAPAVILLHGGGGSMRKNFLFPTTARWKTLADEFGFLLLSPNGVSAQTGSVSGDQQTWYGLRPGRDGRRSTVDDVAFLAALAKWAVDEKGADPRRIYVDGASNGGEMVFRLLIERPELFAAGVANIASLPAIDVPKAMIATPIMMLNGTEDPLMPWNGGAVARVAEAVRPVLETVKYWLDVNGADPKSAKTLALPDNDPGDGCRITVTSYASSSSPDPVVLFYRVDGGGHGTPFPDRTPLPSATARMLGNQCHDADATALAWEFMRSHRR